MRRLLVLATLAVAASALAADAIPAPRPQLSRPDVLELGEAAGLASPSSIPTVATLAASPASWGGLYLTPAGESVHIQVSDAYPQDAARAQQWANFIGSLVHGSEITNLTLYLAPLTEIKRLCGATALACYSPQEARIAAPGDDPTASLSSEAVVAHEYGHHVAANRLNPPWDAVDYGAKRWASYEQVCRNAQQGNVFPGAEDQFHYQLNPGEGWAEAYRVLNERRLALGETSWDIVDQSFYPDDAALAALEQDVLSPWQATTTSLVRGSFTRKGTTKTFSISTPLDGSASVVVRSARTTKIRAELLSSGLKAGTVTVAGGVKTLPTVVCGVRTLTVRVSRLAGSGSYSLTFSRS